MRQDVRPPQKASGHRLPAATMPVWVRVFVDSLVERLPTKPAIKVRCALIRPIEFEYSERRGSLFAVPTCVFWVAGLMHYIMRGLALSSQRQVSARSDCQHSLDGTLSSV
jgi:hypothetical protein